MKIKLFTLAFLSLTFISIAQTKTFTLEESIAEGLKNSKNLIIAKTNSLIAESKIVDANSFLLPKLSFLASYTRLSDVPPFEVKLPSSPVPVKISDPVLNSYILKLGIQQPIFTGNRLSSMKKSAEFQLSATQQDYEKEANDESLNIQTAFWNFYRAGEIKHLAEENYKQIAARLEDTRNYFNNATATKNEVLKFEVLASSSKLKIIEASNNLLNAKAIFCNAIGLKIDEKVEIKTAKISYDESKLESGTLIAEAKEKRKELKSLRFKLSSADEGKTAAKSGVFPSLYLTSNLYYNRPNQRIFPQRDQFDEGWDVGVSLTWDLWDWGHTSSQVEIAEQQISGIATSISKTEDAVELDVYRNMLALNSSIEKIKVSQKSVEQAEEQNRLTSEIYKERLTTATELIEAQTSLLKAKTDLTESLVEYIVAKTKLDKAIGRKIY